MNRRQFLQAGMAAAAYLLFRNRMKAVAAATSTNARIPDPTPPPGQGVVTIPFFVGRPRDEQVFIPIIRRTYTE